MFICFHIVRPFLCQKDMYEENLPVYVRVGGIIDFCRKIETRAGRREEYTVVHLANDGTLTVQETPEEIFALINGATNDA